MTSNDDNTPVPAIPAGLRGRCPRCGRGRLFSGFLTLAPRCEQCGLDYAFADAGDGPAVFVSLIAGAFGVGLALTIDATFEPPLWVHLLVSLPLTALICLAVLRPIKGLLVALQFRNKAEQGRVEGS